VTSFGQTFDRCPLAWVRDEAAAARAALDDWTMLKSHGVMLAAGGLLDQPASYVDALRVIDDESERCREIARRRAGEVTG
jgi:hypothetical protein